MTFRKQLSRLAEKIPMLGDRTLKSRVQARWGSGEFFDELEDTYWMRSRAVREHLNQLATGHPDTDWLTWLRRQIFVTDETDESGRGVARCLVLGCGEGWLERKIAAWPEIGHIDAQDVAGDAVAKAHALAHQAGLEISYRTSDLNVDPLEGCYDLIVAHSVLHHINELEFALDQIRGALKPGGVVAINEYVGPARLQYSDAALQAINEIMAILPERYRISTLTGKPVAHKARPPVEYLMSVDPSEAARSDELHDLIHEHLNVRYEAPLNGSLLQQLLYEIVGNFDDESSHDRALVRLMAAYEEILHEVGALEPDYAFFVATSPGDDTDRRFERAPVVDRHYFTRPSRGLSQAWREWPTIERHHHELPTKDHKTDWWTRIKQWLVDDGVTSESPILVFGESWLEPVLREVASCVTVANDDDLQELPSDAFRAVITTGGLGSSRLEPRLLLETLSRALQPGGCLVTNERRHPREQAGAWTARLAMALEPLFPAEDHFRLEAAGRQHPLDLLPDHFTVEHVFPCGGELLESILGSHETTWQEVTRDHGFTLVELLCLIERRLLEDGHLEPEHVVVLARS